MRCLVTAIGSMSAEAVIQAASRMPNTVVIGCNMYPKGWTAASRLVERFHQVPSARDAQAYLACLVEICRHEQISHILPLTDTEVDVLSENRSYFDDMGVTLCISPQPAISAARDKLALHQRFARHPRIHPIPTADFHGSEQPGFAYPLLAKPRRGRSSEGHVNIQDADALLYWHSRLIGQEYLVQPHIDGEVFVVDVVRQPDGRKSVAMTRQELLRTPNGAGMTVWIQAGHACDALALEVADSIGLYGCVNIEFLMVDGAPLLMDVNPRFSAGVVFTMLSGYDMVSNHVRCFQGGMIDSYSIPPNRVYARSLVEYSLQD